MKNICMVFTFYCSSKYAEFLPHIPIRTMDCLPENVKLHVLYYGYIDEQSMLDHGIQVKRMRGGKSKVIFIFFKWAILFWNSLVFGFKEKIALFINANYHVNFLYVEFAAVILRCKRIARVTGEVICSDPKDLARKINRWLKKIKERISIGMANSTIVLSNSLKQSLLNRGIPEKGFRVIPQGVDTQKFQSHPQRTDSSKSILFVGRIRKEKGIWELLTAFDVLYKELPEIKLEVYGYEDVREPVLKRWRSHPGIRFHGHVMNKDMPKAFVSADILVLPSYAEGLPNVVMEAMSSGVVVIASKVGGIPELLENGDCGILISPRNPMEIEAALRRLIKDSKLKNMLATKARQRIDAYYSMNKVRKEFRELLNSL